MKKVLVLEDESSIRSFIVINLRRAGYEVVEAESGEEALEKLKLHSDVRVALLDIMLPGIDGFEVCRRIRATNASIGIIMLTARSQEMDKVTGLMTGADDYVTKPFSPAELTARVDALMRRSGGAAVEAGEINQPPFLLNTRNRTLEKNGQRIKLTQVEYAIMKMFMENPGKALSREEILDMVWGHDYFGELKIVDVNIRRLRLKIEDNATNPTYITTIWASATSGVCDSGSFPPVLRCVGLTYTRYACASAPRPDEKSLAVPPCLVWRKNPRITIAPPRLVLAKNLSLSRCAAFCPKGDAHLGKKSEKGTGPEAPVADRQHGARTGDTAAGGRAHLRGLCQQLLQQRPLRPAGEGRRRRGLFQHLCDDQLPGVLPQRHGLRRRLR